MDRTSTVHNFSDRHQLPLTDHSSELSDMEENDGFDIDPAIAASMGFSSFGHQGKKRKYDADDAFVDPAASLSLEQGKSNAPDPAHRGLSKDSEPQNVAPATNAVEVPVTSTAPRAGEPASGYAAPSGYVSKYTLEELRLGVKNDKGDLVYFQPCFIENPWTKFESERKIS